MEDIETLPALRQALIQRVGEDRFDLWFGTNTSLRLEDECLIVASASRVNLDFLRKSFHEAMSLALGDVQLAGLPIVYRETEPTSPVAGAKRTPAAESNATAVKYKPESESKGFQRRRFASLDDFIQSDCNSMASTAAQMVLKQPGQISPLYVHGPSGCGKTHLLEGVYSLAQQHKPLGRVVYLSAEQFTTFFLDALQSSGVANFRRKYRDVGVLILDDIQFFTGKRATITELQHTLDAIARRGGQVILAGTRRPTELPALGAEMVARLSSGLICKMECLDDHCKTHLIQRMAGQRGIRLSDSTMQWLVTHLPGEGRMISGAINRLWAWCAVEGNSVHVDALENLLADLIPARSSMVRMEDVVGAVCRQFEIDLKTLRSQTKSRRASNPRMLAMYLARKHTAAALSDICAYFHRRSHSTVISALNKVNQWKEQSEAVQFADRSLKIQEAIDLVEASLRNPTSSGA